MPMPMAPSNGTFRCSDVGLTTSLGDVTLGLHLRHLRLVFSVSRDEEYVELRACCEPSVFDMGARKHNYLLLTLARRRLADATDRHSDANCGWVYQEELEHDPAMAPPKLNMDIFRIRRQFVGCHVVDAARIVERRPQTRQLRLGTGQIAIVNL